MRVFLTGGTGFIGSTICKALHERGDTAVVLSRNPAKAKSKLPASAQIIEGDPVFAGDWQNSLVGCDAVINLAGEPLDAKRWNAQFRQRLHDSRIDSTRFLVEAIASCPKDQRPEVLVSASGIDYYGFAELDGFDEDKIAEDGAGGESYLAALCWDWEEEAKAAQELGVRVVRMRTGLVLGEKGALPNLLGPARKGVGKRLGSGKQWMSWVHIADAVGAYLFAIDSKLEGPVNLAAPGNERNRDFMKILGKVLGKTLWAPVPAKAIAIATGPLSEYLLKGRRAHPQKLLEAGYEFVHPELEPALRAELGK